MATTASSGAAHLRVDASPAMGPPTAERDDDEERGQDEGNAPVDLVCAKHKFEPAPAPGLDAIPDSSLALSFLMRRRRRGRARYSPFPCSGCSSHADLSPGLPSSALGVAGSGGRAGQFVCPHCKALFPNRDALAMHMLDSVRSDGVCGGGPSAGSATASAPAPAPAPVSCRVCAKSLPSLDALAMHMLAHAHQEGLHSVMQRVASHYSDLLQHGFAPPLPVAPPAAPDRRSPDEAKPAPAADDDAPEDGPVVVKVEEEEAEEAPGVRDEEEEEAEEAAAEEEAKEGEAGGADAEEEAARRDLPFPFVCRHCLVAFADRTMFCLHMGLHNVNHPWQCNMCGKACAGRHEFASHVLHF